MTTSEGDTSVATMAKQSKELKRTTDEQLPTEAVQAFDRGIADLLEKGLPSNVVKVGDRLGNFILNDALGRSVSLEEIVATGPAVVVFYRGGWCPYCNLALRTYQLELLPLLNAVGARLVAISPQNPDESLSTSEKANLSFTVLSDPGSRLAERLGIAFQPSTDVLAAQNQLGLDLSEVNAEGSTLLPRPTVLIIDQNRYVEFVDVQSDYTIRTEVADIAKAVKAMPSTKRSTATR
jgi:peroxiredoxin